MIALLFSKIFDFIISFVNLLLSPIDLIINQFLPDLSTALGYVNSMINLALNSISYVVSLTMLNPDLVAALYAYVLFLITVPITIRSIKLVIKWYNILKP